MGQWVKCQMSYGNPKPSETLPSTVEPIEERGGTQVAAFNLENYLENSRKVDLSEFDFSQAREYALTPDEIRCLEYMMDVESSTIVYLRAVLRTCIIDDPESVAFLSCWAYEEYFHGRTIREFLKASGVEIRSDRYVQVKRNATFRERLEEMGTSLMCHLTRHFHAPFSCGLPDVGRNPGIDDAGRLRRAARVCGLAHRR